MPYGDFNEHAQGVWDFVRCQRPNGSYYGTAGKCRQGTEVSAKAKAALAKLKPEQLKQLEKNPKLSSIQKKAVKEEIVKQSAGAGTKEEYASLMKRQQELVGKGDMKGAMDLNPKLKDLTDRMKAEDAKDPKLQKEQAALRSKRENEIKEIEEFKKRQEGYDKLQEEARTKLSPKDQKAITDYTSSFGAEGGRSYKNLNKCLRKPDTCPDTPAAKAYGEEFKTALAKLPKNASGDPFYRGVMSANVYKILENAQPGTKIKDPGYGSYSTDKREAEDFMNLDTGKNNVLFISRNKNLTPISKFSKIQSEAEAIMPSDQEQTIRAVRKDGDTLVIEFD